jgi:phage gpG-like protein
MAGITLSLTHDELLSESAILRMEAATGDMTDLMSSLGEALVRSAHERIAQTNVGPDGKPWAQSKRAIQAGGKTLHKSGTLRSSISYLGGPDSVEVGSSVVYSAVHQLGAAVGAFGVLEGIGKGGKKRTLSIPFGDIPARPYLGVSSEDREVISELAESYFDGVIGGDF